MDFWIATVHEHFLNLSLRFPELRDGTSGVEFLSINEISNYKIKEVKDEQEEFMEGHDLFHNIIWRTLFENEEKQRVYYFPSFSKDFL